MSELYDLCGHDRAFSLWEEALRRQRMHHAWLFCGVRGIGKASLAKILIRRLLEIPAGSKIESHPDLLVLEREMDDRQKRRKAFITVENVRRVSEFFSKSAGRGGWRACIVDSADEMNLNAANALLKILEEPPARGLFLLISHQPDRLLATLRSRCRRLRLNSLDGEAMSRLLRQQYPGLSREQHDRLLLLAEGSPGRARALLGETGTSGQYENDAGSGLELYREMMDLLQGLPGKFDMSTAHGLADRLSAGGKESLYREFMELLRDFLERFVRAGLDESRRGQLPERELQLLARLQPGNFGAWIGVWEKIDAWIDAVERLQMNRKQTLLLAFAQLEAVAG